MGFNDTYNNILATSWGKFYWSRKPEYPEKTIDLPQVNDKQKIVDLIIVFFLNGR